MAEPHAAVATRGIMVGEAPFPFRSPGDRSSGGTGRISQSSNRAQRPILGLESLLKVPAEIMSG